LTVLHLSDLHFKEGESVEAVFGPLREDQEDVAEAVGMKAGLGIQVAAEGLAVMDGTNSLLKSGERFLDCRWLFRSPALRSGLGSWHIYAIVNLINAKSREKRRSDLGMDRQIGDGTCQ
jgi:hypothetical protein